MIESNIFKAPPFIVEKISNLYRLLLQEKGEFEQVAGNITDNELRCTILTLAQKNSQYAAELSCHMQTTGGMETPGGVAAKEYNQKILREAGTGIFPDENGVLAFCSRNEKKMVTAYREILKESALYEGLRKMMKYQLNGILFTFMQLKLLTSLKNV